MNFLNGSFRVGQIFGINVRVHFLWLLWIAFNLFDSGGAWLSTAVFLAVLFGIVLLHEFGHCLGARSVGGDARDILMWPLGGLAYAHAPMRPWPQFVTVACGPLVNLVFCLVSGGVVYAYTRSLDLVFLNPFGGVHLPSGNLNWLACTWIFYQVNLLLLSFNLLPIYPMDGGQLFQAIIWPYVGLHRATLIACYLGLAGATCLGMWGLMGGGGILIFIALFGGFTCYQRLQMLRYGMVIEDTRFTTYGDTAKYARRRGFWSRLFKRRSGAGPRTPVEYPAGRPSANPNPGAWQAKVDERDAEEAELDRILKKVSEHGIHSLSYVERQSLERMTRERQERERDFERQTRL